MRRSGPMEFRGIAAVTLIGVAAFASTALAQEESLPPSVRLGDLFGEDSVILTEEKASELIRAARQAQAPAGRPLGELYIVTPEGDRLYQDAIAGERRKEVVNVLHRAGIDVTRFFVESIVAGAEHSAWLSHDLDRQPPRLHTSSLPASGNTVRPGAVIKVTMVARDDAFPRAWQTGIKAIQLVADSDGGRFVASESYEPCADAPPPPDRRVVATYTVPPCDPPVVRLSALAEDHAALMDTDAAEFPVDRQDEDDCDDEDESRDGGGGQDSDGEACVRTWIIHGREVSFLCP